jgi:hypothetical protein
VKNVAPPLPGAYRAPYCGVLLDICKVNMARRLAKRRAKKYGIGNATAVPASTPHAWVHQCDPKFMDNLMGVEAEDLLLACSTIVPSTPAPPRLGDISSPVLLPHQYPMGRNPGTSLAQLRSSVGTAVSSDTVQGAGHGQLRTSTPPPEIAVTDLATVVVACASTLEAHFGLSSFAQSNPRSTVCPEMNMSGNFGGHAPHASNPGGDEIAAYASVSRSHED